MLESGMKKLAKLYKESFGVDVSDLPGAGAAGIIQYLGENRQILLQ